MRFPLPSVLLQFSRHVGHPVLVLADFLGHAAWDEIRQIDNPFWLEGRNCTDLCTAHSRSRRVDYPIVALAGQAGPGGETDGIVAVDSLVRVGFIGLGEACSLGDQTSREKNINFGNIMNALILL